MANSTGSYGVSFVDLVDGAVAVVGVVSISKNVFAITNIGITRTIATKQSTVDFGP